MKTRTRLLSILLLLCMVVPMLPLTSLIAWAGTLDLSRGKTDAMTAIEADGTLASMKQGDTQKYTDDGYIGIPYEVSVYYDYATHGKSRNGYMTEGATPVMMYVVNTNTERVGTDSDVSIIKSMLSRGYVVVVVDYLNNEKAKSPALDWSTQILRNKAKKGDYFKNSTVFASGEYDDTLTVPAGYDVRLNDVYFELDKHGVDGTLEEIVELWNNDFRGVNASVIVKWVHEDGTRKATQTAPDGSSPVWYADAAGKTVDNANGQYTKVGYTLAKTITDCVKADGSPIDLNLYMHTIYPTNPAKEVPAVILYSSSASLSAALNKEDRPQFAGFLFNGYAGAIAEYAYIPMSRSGQGYKGFSGDAAGGVTGVNMTYATYTYNATQSASAAVRMLRYLALAEDYPIDVDHVGAYGISKTAWYTQLGAPVLRNDLITKEDGMTDAEIAQHVNDKINSFVQLLLPEQSSGRTRYDNGVTESYTVDGFTVDGGELQPWAVYDGAEISSGVQANYSSCGAFVDYFTEGYAPQFISENLSDTSNTEYGQQNIMVALCRTLDLPALWFEIDIEHTFAQGLDYNYGVDTYDAFFKFMGYYLKNAPVSVCYTNPVNGAVLDTTDGITVKFVGEVSASEIQKVKVTDASGNALTGTWTSAYGNTEWTFLADNMKGATAYTLTVPANMVGENGVAMGKAYTASFYTRPEGDVTALNGAATLNENGTTVNLTVPAKTADGYKIRVNVQNDAANTLYAYNAANGELMGSVRVSGAGFHEIDLTDYLASYAAGTEIAVTLKTAKAASLEDHFEATYDTDQGGMGFKFSELTPGCEIDGAKALKVVRIPEYRSGEYSMYPNMENSYTFSTNKLIKNGSAVTKEDLGRTFRITLRVYDTVSRPVRIYMNNVSSRPDKQLDFDRNYYTFETKANEWSEFEVTYTVYEMKYGWNSQVKTLYVQFTPQGGCDGAPIYLDNLKVEEVFTDLDVSSISLVSEKNSGMGVKTPVGTKPFKVGSVEYATWKDAMNAATSGSTVTMQSNYTLTDADIVNLSAKNNLTIDLGGYRLTAKNTKNAPLWGPATSTSALNVTLKNGSVILSDTPLVGYGSSSSAGKGKVINVNLENLYLSAAENGATLNVASERTVSGATGVVSNVSFTDCVIDVERENLPDKTLNGLIYFPVGDAALSVKYAFAGGKIIANGFHEAVFCEGIINALPNASGQYLQVLLPASVAAPSASFKKGSDYASLKSTSAYNGYSVYDVVKSDYSTAYGAIPNEYADTTKYPFAIFMDEAFIGAGNWKTTNETVKAALNNKPGATVNVLLRADYTSETYIGNANWLCFMNGTFNLDLGGRTVTTDQSLFEAGVDSTYAGTYNTTFNVKNGTVLVGGGNMCGAQQNSNYNKKMDITFENVTFGLASTFATKRNKLFYGSNNASVTGVLDVNITLKNCTFDMRNIPCAYTVFAYGNTTNSVAADIKVIGGKILTDNTVGNVTWYNVDAAGAADTILFEKGSDGKYITMSVVNGTKPNAAFPTKDGVFGFGELVTDGTDYDVYTLKNDSSASPYGSIPAAYAENTFVIFTNGSCIGGKDTWKDTLTLVRSTLDAKPGSSVQILMQKDREVTSYVGSANWLCFMNGSILLDMNGHTLTAKSTSLFEMGVDASYTGNYKTTLTVKNGTILQGNGNVCGIQNNSTYAKTFVATFENVDFGTDVAFDGSKRTNLIYAQNNCKANVDVTLTLTDCDIDVSKITTKYTVFSFASSDTRVSADIKFNGGSIKADSFTNITFLTLDSTNDTFVWGKGTDGKYATLTLPASVALPTLGGVNDEGTSVAFRNGVLNGDYKVYTLEGDPLVTKYGNIPESAADADANPFVLFDANKNYLGAASTWKNAQEKAKTYLDSNPGKTVYVLMRADTSNTAWLKSAGILNGTLVLDLGGRTMYRADNSVIEANTNGLTEAQCAFTTNIIVKNGTVLTAKTSSANGHVVAVESHLAYNKTYNITFEGVTFAVSRANYNPDKGLNTVIASVGKGNGTGKVTANMTFRDCDVIMVDDTDTVVPASTRLFFIQSGTQNAATFVIEGGSYTGTMSGISFTAGDAAKFVKFVKDASGKYFAFNLSAGSAPSTEFGSDRGTVKFVKSGNAYTLAVKASAFGNAFIPLDQYDDTNKYPFIVYVDGKLISASTGWKPAQEAAQKYLESNNGATVYIKMRRDVESVEWFKSAGVFNGTVVLDLGGYTLCRRDNSFIEACTNGLTAAQCQFVSNIIVKNGTLLAGKTANNNGHVVAIQSNGAYDKSFNITFENITFGISKLNYAPDKGLFALAIRDNGAAAGATGKVSVNFILKDCVFDLTESDETTVPTKSDTTIIYTNPSSAQNNVNITIEGGTFKGTHNKVTFINAGENTTVTYKPNAKGEYFKYELSAGTPKAAAVNTDKGEGFFIKGEAEGEYVLAIGKAKFEGVSIKLGTSLAIRYRVKIHDTTLLSKGSLSMQFTFNGETVTVTAYEIENGMYIFVFDGIAPQQMADLIDAKFFVGDEVIIERTGYSILQNCKDLLAASAEQLGISDAKYAALRTVVADLVAYGKAAQDYKDYDKNGVISIDGVIGTDILPTEADRMTLLGNTNSLVRFTSANVRFDTLNSIIVKVRVNVENPEAVMIKVDGKIYTLSELESLGDGVYQFTIEDIKAINLGKAYTFELIYDGESVATLAYSVNAYAYAMSNGATENAEMQALALALYRYGASAVNYANAQ